MSAPLYISKDEMREHDNMNFSVIDQYYTDKGYTEDYVSSQYNLAFIGKSLKTSFISSFFKLYLPISSSASRFMSPPGQREKR